MEKTLTLYSTSGCHLCDRAAALLSSMPELARFTVTVVDIALDPDLLARFAERIPVLCDGKREIAWPFNADDVVDLVERSR